jgi:ribosomal-protein-alanine N-acetyltransferase
MNTIETERLILRNFRQDDWTVLHQIINVYMSSKLAQYDHQWPTSEDEIQKFAEWFAAGDSYVAVCLKPDDQLIGFVAFNPEKHEGERVFNLGYVFHFDYHGKGYATEACKAALSYAFDELHAVSVISGTAAANGASCRLLGRLGFKMTSQNLMSFKKGNDGKPIEFMGCSFELSREDWRAGDIFPVHW